MGQEDAAAEYVTGQKGVQAEKQTDRQRWRRYGGDMVERQRKEEGREGGRQWREILMDERRKGTRKRERLMSFLSDG